MIHLHAASRVGSVLALSAPLMTDGREFAPVLAIVLECFCSLPSGEARLAGTLLSGALTLARSASASCQCVGRKSSLRYSLEYCCAAPALTPLCVCLRVCLPAHHRKRLRHRQSRRLQRANRLRRNNRNARRGRGLGPLCVSQHVAGFEFQSACGLGASSQRFGLDLPAFTW